MTRFLLIQPDEDGNPIRWLDQDDMDELMADPKGSYGVTKFLTAWPERGHPSAGSDPAYWPEGWALLLQANIVTLEPEEVVVRYRVKHV